MNSFPHAFLVYELSLNGLFSSFLWGFLCSLLCGFCRACSAWTDYLDELGRDGGAEARAAVPACASLEAAVVALGDVAEGGLAFRGVDRGLEEANGFAVYLVGYGDETGPERSDGTGATDDHVLAVDANVVAASGVGVSGYVGNATASG